MRVGNGNESFGSLSLYVCKAFKKLVFKVVKWFSKFVFRPAQLSCFDLLISF